MNHVCTHVLKAVPRRRAQKRACMQMWLAPKQKTFLHLSVGYVRPFSIVLFLSELSSHGSCNSSQYRRHSVKVVNSTCVMNTKFFIKEWLYNKTSFSINVKNYCFMYIFFCHTAVFNIYNSRFKIYDKLLHIP